MYSDLGTSHTELDNRHGFSANIVWFTGPNEVVPKTETNFHGQELEISK